VEAGAAPHLFISRKPVDQHLVRDLPEDQVTALSAVAAGGRRPGVDVNRGWEVDTVGGEERYAVFGTADGRRAAIERVPARGAAVILLTGDAGADARGLADRLLAQLLTEGPS